MITAERETDFVTETWSSAIPPDPTPPVQWCIDNVRLPGSARSDRFDPTITPWIVEPLVKAFDPETRQETFVKPVQSGGSVLGECVLCRTIATSYGGDIQYNWQTNDKAGERWDKRIERILTACPGVRARWPADKNKAKRRFVMFPHLNLTVQGVKEAKNLDSDSIRVQLNEEIHGWEDGRLEKARRRTTAFWNDLTVNISNAGRKGDQLNQAFDAGTMQRWEVRCPGCGKFHVMRTRFEKFKAKLGGLRYDAEGCRIEDGYNYEKLARTIRYQFPCGATIKDNPTERRALSLSGRYTKPNNAAANLGNLSYTYDAISVDYIPWIELIQEKHRALAAMRYGDPEPFRRYVTERECNFWTPEDRPIVGNIVLSKTKKKNREGLPNRAARFAALDFQRGKVRAGLLEHYWAVIRDVDESGNSLLVWEGKVDTDEDAKKLLDEHDVDPILTVVDTGYNASHVYAFCLKYGYNAIKGGKTDWYSHPAEDEGDEPTQRRYSVARPLHAMLNRDRTKPDAPEDEPEYWLYSKFGIRDRLDWIRSKSSAVTWEVPGDVSEDYRAHMESEERKERKDRNGALVIEYEQVRTRNDLYVCECYIGMLMEQYGFIGVDAVGESV